MTWSEHTIARAIALQTLARKCVVLVDNCNWTGHECDVLAVTNDLRIIDIEVKISRADLKADAKKDKWWRRYYDGTVEEVTLPGGRKYQRQVQQSTPLVHPRKVWKHYYALPQEIWKPELLECLPSKASGVILMREQRNSVTPVVAEVVRRATPEKDAFKLTPAQVMDIARLANLRMWEAYRLRDAEAKLHRQLAEARRGAA